MTQYVRIAVTRRGGKGRALMNKKDITARIGEEVRWLCTNLDDGDLWVQVHDFRTWRGKKNPLNRLNPSVRVPGAGASGNPNTRLIAARVKAGAEKVSYKYDVRVGTSSTNLKKARDPKLRVDDNNLAKKRPTPRKRK